MKFLSATVCNCKETERERENISFRFGKGKCVFSNEESQIKKNIQERTIE